MAKSKHIEPAAINSLPASSLIWIDPRTCTHYVNIGGLRMSGVICSGDWDLDTKPITNMIKIKACLDHWREGISWEESGIYEYMEDLIAKKSRRIDGCHSRTDIVNRYARMDLIYQEIKTDKRLKTAFERGVTTDPALEPSGVVIHFGRDGEPLFSGSGHHRLSIAIALGLTEMPVMLGAIHPRALPKIQKRLARAAAKQNLKEGHPMGYQTTRSTQSKFDLIKDSIDIKNVHSLLDIGCNEGILTSMFSNRGIFCVGIDISKHFVDRFEVSKTPAFGVLPMTQELAERIPQFDTILLLSVHHQWIKSLGEESARKLVTTIAFKAKKHFVVEFAAIATKYGYSKAPFKDNDETSLIEYAFRWLRELQVPGEVRHIGKNPELPGREPYRYSFVIDRAPVDQN